MRRLAIASVAVLLWAHPGAASAPPVPVLVTVRLPHRIAQPAPAADELPAVLLPLRPYLAILTSQARAQGLPPSLVFAVALVESGGNPGAVSPAGAQGLLQVLPSAWPSLCPCSAPTANVRAGVHILRVYADLEGADPDCLAEGPGGDAACAWATDRALSAYNSGPRGGFQEAYVAAVRRAWVQTKGAMAA